MHQIKRLRQGKFTRLFYTFCAFIDKPYKTIDQGLFDGMRSGFIYEDIHTLFVK